LLKLSALRHKLVTNLEKTYTLFYYLSAQLNASKFLGKPLKISSSISIMVAKVGFE